LDKFLRSVSYIFHPIFLPFFGICIFYSLTYNYYTVEYIQSRVIQLFILTIIIPLLIFRVLKKLQFASSLMLEKIKERRFPYLIAVVLNLYITQYVFTESMDLELHYFFAGICFTSITFLILSYLNYKASLHTAAISGATMFIIALSIHFQLNLILGIGFLILLNGLVATSRLHLKAHTTLELIIGFIIGLSPQFMMMIYWV
jgi:hypothetical protein